MLDNNLFIVIEGLDGSGKTEISRRLTQLLAGMPQYKGNVKLTFEPHDPSAAGVYIRQVLMKKIKKFTSKTLALAFAANRLDHCEREIKPFLSQGKNRIMICDRYYLSSLVYQTDNQTSMNEIMNYNNKALKPDIILFLNVSNKVCYERMKKRAEAKELFEKNLSQTRDKYFEAIEFLRSDRNENIVEVNADGSIDEVLEEIDKKLSENFDIHFTQPAIFSFVPEYFSIDKEKSLTLRDFAMDFAQGYSLPNEKVYDLPRILEDINVLVNQKVSETSYNDLGLIFLDYLTIIGYEVGERLAWTDLDAFELKFGMPLGVEQQGVALFINQAQRIDVVLKKAMQIERNMSDFMFVFDPSDFNAVDKHFERELIHQGDNYSYLIPNTKSITKDKIKRVILGSILEMMFLTNPITDKVERMIVNEYITREGTKVDLLKQENKNVPTTPSKLDGIETLPF